MWKTILKNTRGYIASLKTLGAVKLFKSCLCKAKTLLQAYILTAYTSGHCKTKPWCHGGLHKRTMQKENLGVNGFSTRGMCKTGETVEPQRLRGFAQAAGAKRNPQDYGGLLRRPV